VTDVAEGALRREQALQLERTRLALRKASRMDDVDADAARAWNQLGVAAPSVSQVRELLLGIATIALREMKGQALPPDSLAALGVVKDALSAVPTPELPLATCKLMRIALAPDTATVICGLHDRGFQIVPSDALPAVRLLARDKLLPADVALLQSDRGPGWRLFADAALLALDRAPLNMRQLIALWDPQCVFDPAWSSFYSKAAFYRAYDLTRQRNFDAAWEQAETFGDLASYTTTPLQKEVINLRAYLIMLRYGEHSLEEAIELLTPIGRSPAVKQNLKFIRQRKLVTRNERGPLENPYLALGVDHGAARAAWRRAWLAARSAKHADLDYLSEVNEAHDQIMALERDGSDGAGRVFMVPVGKEFRPPGITEAADRLTAGPPPVPAFQGGEPLSEVIQKLRGVALREILIALDS
jgi:hypothetical protein